MKAQRGVAVQLYPVRTSTLDGGVVVSTTLRPLCPRAGTPVFVVKEAGWVPVPVWTGVEKRKCLSPTRVRTPNRPACCESLYELPYTGHNIKLDAKEICFENVEWIYLAQVRVQW